MTTKIDGLTLPNKTIDKMKDLIHKTKTAKVEFGLSLCKEKDNDIIKQGHECVGTECSILMRPECFGKDMYIGNYHTHPKSDTEMSFSDMHNACPIDVSCIGSAIIDQIRCYTRKTDKMSCIINIEPLKKRAKLLKEKNDAINKSMEAPEKLSGHDISRLMRVVAQHGEDLKEFDKTVKKVSGYNFKEINIR